MIACDLEKGAQLSSKDGWSPIKAIRKLRPLRGDHPYPGSVHVVLANGTVHNFTWQQIVAKGEVPF